MGSSLPKYFMALNFSPGCKSNTAFYLQMWFSGQKFSGAVQCKTYQECHTSSPFPTEVPCVAGSPGDPESQLGKAQDQRFKANG